MTMTPSENTRITQIMPANDWFFFYRADNQPKLLRLAAWGQDQDGLVVGLVPASELDLDSPYLVTVPTQLSGQYLHSSQFSQEHEALLKRNDSNLMHLFYGPKEELSETVQD